MNRNWMFWVAVATSPLWLIPAAVIAFLLLVAWLIAKLLVFGMCAVFAVFDKEDWIQKLNALPFVGNFLEW